MRVFRFLGSLKLAVILLVMLSTILAAATYYESIYDPKTAQHLVYHSAYFALFLGLLFVNVLCSTLSRFPWKSHQLGFVVTHLGILILLIGSAVTMVAGVEGTLSLEEGESSSRVIIDAPILTVDVPGQPTREIPAEFRWLRPQPDRPVRVDLGAGLVARVERYLHHSQAELLFVEDANSSRAAARIRLKNARVDQSQWLTTDGGDITLGLASLGLRRLSSEEEVRQFLTEQWEPRQRGELQLLVADRPYRLKVEDLLTPGKETGEAVPIKGTDYQVRVVRYLAHAAPVDGKLVSKSDKPVNPMVELEVFDSHGSRQTWLLFGRLPDLNTRTGSSGQELPLKLLYTFGETQAKRRLVVGLDGQDKLYAKVDRKPGVPVTLGQPLPTGWMDIQFTAEQLVPHAQEKRELVEVAVEKGEDGGPPPAIMVAVEGSRRSDAFWLQRGDVTKLEKDDGTQIRFGYSYRAMDLGFPIKLKEFHVDRNPGTTTAAAFRSIVVVEDREQQIQMNEPMALAGYKFFQASYGESAAGKRVSIFSVAKDPGIELKYAGSLMLVVGIAIMFYVRPYQLKNRRRPESESGEE